MRKILFSENVKNSGDIFRDITDQLPIGVIILQDGFVRYVNDALSNIIEYSKEEIRKWSNYDLFKLVYQNDLLHLKEKFEQLQNMRIGGVLKYSFRAISKSKKIKWVELNSKPILYQGEPAIYVSAIDLGEKKETEQELKESDIRLHAFMNASPDSFAILDSELNYLEIDETGLKVFGKTKEEVIGKNILDLNPALKGTDRYNKYLEVIKTGRPFYIDDFIPHPRFGNLYLNVRTFKVGNGLGAIVRDITERRFIEQKLKESEERYRLISESANDLIAILNDKFKHEYVNEQAYMNVLGYKCIDMIGKTRLDSVHPDDLKKEMKMLKNSFEKGEGIGEIRLKHKNGYYIWVEIKRKSFTDYNGKVKILTISRDITEKKQAEHKLKELSRVINIAGRQRMLSQKMSKEALIITILRSNKKKNIEQLKNTRFLFETSHHGLRYGDSSLGLPETNNLDAIKQWARINALWQNFRNLIITVEKSNHSEKLINKIIEKSNSLLKEINYLVEIFEQEANGGLFLESEEKYRLISENANDLIQILNDNLEIEYINETSHLDIIGYTKKDLIGKSIQKFLHPTEVDELIDNLKKASKIRGGIREGRIRNKDGGWIWFDIRYKMFIDYSGNHKFLIISRNITKHKEDEGRLKESEEKYKTILDGIVNGVWVTDKDDVIYYTNNGMEKIAGIPSEQIVNCRVLIDFPESTLKYFRPYYLKAKNTLNSVFYDAVPVETPAGRQSFQTGWLIPIEKEGKYDGIICTVEDVTERKKVEQKLKESEQKFRNIIQDLDVGYYNIGMDGKLIFHNSSFNKIAGYDLSENLIGTKAMDFWFNPIDRKIFMEQILYKEYVENFVANVKRKNGGKIFVELNSHLVKDELGDPISIEGTLFDITEKLEYEQKLKEETIRLREINEFKTNLLNRTSHELQTPLISIKGFTDILLSKYEHILDTDMADYLEIINKNANRLVKTIRSMIDTAYLEKEIFKINVYTEDLAFLIRNCVKNYQRLIKLRKQSVVLDIQDILITKLDKEGIYRVLESLFENAINNTPTGGKIEIQSEIKGGNIIVSIKDNGVGLTKEEQEQLFQPFGKIERYGRGVDVIIEGPGLSLYICKKIIELHGGEIWVASKGRNKGSIFYFSIPIISE